MTITENSSGTSLNKRAELGTANMCQRSRVLKLARAEQRKDRSRQKYGGMYKEGGTRARQVQAHT